MLANVDEPGILLVHAEARSRDPRAVGGRMGHVWVEVGESVYDHTVRDEPSDRGAYHADARVLGVQSSRRAS